MSRDATAAVLPAQGERLRVEQIVLPDPAPGQVVVELAAAGVCHSDLSLANGLLRQPVPVVLGHEGAGIVVEVGAGVGRVAPGDRVVLCWAPPCRACRACLRGEPHLCPNSTAAAQTPYATRADGTDLYAGIGTGAFATETLVGETACVRIDADVSLELAALVGCAVATGVGAVLTTARVAPDESVVVIGLGGVGLSVVQGARLARAAVVVAVDPDPSKRDLALTLGATHVLAPGDELSREVRALTDGDGADHAFEAVGRAATIRAAWSTTRRGGRLTIVGVGGTDEVVSFSPMELFHFNRTIGSSIYGSVDPDRDFPRLLGWAASGELDLEALVTGRIGLDGIDDAFSAMSAGQGVRALVIPRRADSA